MKIIYDLKELQKGMSKLGNAENEVSHLLPIHPNEEQNYNYISVVDSAANVRELVAHK